MTIVRVGLSLAIVCCGTIANASAQDKLFGQLSFGQSYSSKYESISPDDRCLVDNPSRAPSYFTGVGLGYIINQSLKFGLFFYHSNYNFNGEVIVSTKLNDGSVFSDINKSKIKIHSNALMIEGIYRVTFLSKKCIDNKSFIFQVTPYISAGLGAVQSTLEGNIVMTAPNFNLPDCTFKLKKHKTTSLAWSVGFGLEFPISEKIKFDVAFKYLNYGKVNSSSKSQAQLAQLAANDGDDTLKHSNLGTKLAIKTVTLGLTYQF